MENNIIIYKSIVYYASFFFPFKAVKGLAGVDVAGCSLACEYTKYNTDPKNTKPTPTKKKLGGNGGAFQISTLTNREANRPISAMNVADWCKRF